MSAPAFPSMPPLQPPPTTTQTRQGVGRGLNIRFGIDSPTPHSPKVGGGNEWTDIDFKSQLMAQLDIIQSEISQLARTRNASLNATTNVGDMLNAPERSPSEDTLIGSDSEDEVERALDSSEEEVPSFDNQQESPSSPKGKSEITRRAGKLAREIRRRRKDIESNKLLSVQDKPPVTLAVAWKDFKAASKTLLGFIWWQLLSFIIVLLAIYRW